MPSCLKIIMYIVIFSVAGIIDEVHYVEKELADVILTSDLFEVTDIIEECDCNCHAGGIKAFFFKLINFFAKLFNPDKRICECGLPH